MQGVKVFYRHQVTATRPMVRKAGWASVKVADLETDEEFRITTEHAVLNIASEVMSGCPPATFRGDPLCHSSHFLGDANNDMSVSSGISSPSQDLSATAEVCW